VTKRSVRYTPRSGRPKKKSISMRTGKTEIEKQTYLTDDYTVCQDAFRQRRGLKAQRPSPNLTFTLPGFTPLSVIDLFLVE